MKKMFRISLSLFLATAFAAHAQVIFEESFDTDGDISVYPGWVGTTGDVFTVTGGEIEMPQGGKLMNSGAAASLLPGDSVLITVDHTLSMTNARAHYGLFGIGVQTNNVDVEGERGADTIEGFEFMFGKEAASWGRYSGVMTYMPDHQQWNTSTLELQATNFGLNPFGFYTNALPLYDDPAYEDPDSDPIRLTYEITKSHIADQFNVTLSVSNLNGTAYDEGTITGIERADAWTSDLYFYLYDATDPGNTSIVQYVKMEKLVPTVNDIVTGVSALGLDNEVSLTWSVAPGASTYDVYRSETQGVQGSLLTTVSSEGHLDSTASNGSTYYYTVVANYYNVDSGPSAQAEATPAKIYTDELVYDEDFELSALGDLAGNDAEWGEISGSSNNAFWVIDEGGTNQAADTLVAESYFTNSVGNGVYLSRNIRNFEDDVLEGSFDIVMQLTADGTNDADQTHSVAVSWGLTSSTADAPDINADSMALFCLGVRAENRLCLSFVNDDMSDSANALAIWGWSEIGWNPKPNGGSWGGSSSLPQDLVTDPLRVSWKIRKTREPGVYQAWASVSNLVQQIATDVQNEFSVQDAPDLYDSPAALFSLAHYKSAHRDGDASTLHATVDNLSFTHSSGQKPEASAPVLTSVLSGDREVIVSWDDVFESTGYSLEINPPDMAPFDLLSMSAETTFTDAPRWNDIVNGYTLTVHFDGDVSPSSLSTNFSASPVGLVPLMSKDGAWGSGTIDYTDRVTNNVPRYIDRRTTPFFDGVATYDGPTLYGVMQSGSIDPQVFVDSGTPRFFGGTSIWSFAPYGTCLVFMNVEDIHSAASINAVADAVYIKVRLDNYTNGNTGQEDSGLRLAVRNGTDWYVSDEVNRLLTPNEDAEIIIIADVAAAGWSPLTVDPAVQMDYVPNTIDTSVFTDINAVGWYCDRFFNARLHEMEVKVSGALASYDYWALNAGLVSTNSAPELDPDGDGISNEREYAFNGDPLVQDTAALPEFVIDADAGTVTATYLKQRDPVSGITTSLKSTADLTLGWSAAGGTETTGVIDYYWTGVTNVVPMGAVDAEFYTVDVDGL